MVPESAQHEEPRRVGGLDLDDHALGILAPDVEPTRACLARNRPAGLQYDLARAQARQHVDRVQSAGLFAPALEEADVGKGSFVLVPSAARPPRKDVPGTGLIPERTPLAGQAPQKGEESP